MCSQALVWSTAAFGTPLERETRGTSFDSETPLARFTPTYHLPHRTSRLAENASRRRVLPLVRHSPVDWSPIFRPSAASPTGRAWLCGIRERLHGSFDLRLTEDETTVARTVLRVLPPTLMLMLSIGAKVDVKDWGDEKWSALLRRLAGPLSDWSLVTLGARVERERSDRILASWPGQALNLCGELSVRESAAALEHARLFVGHDSGPMHLASAVGTTCVAIFSSRNLPGEWFPHGPHHRVLYTDVPCRGCGPTPAPDMPRCIASIGVEDVAREIESAIQIGFGESARLDAPDGAGTKRR